ncbi:PD-(D/E)XK nuclease transposase family protein (plasmid) [Bacillus anthracis str. Vollum]|uniref:PXO1-106 n=2 Tax=Bacillus anthracis TaxID=1392 RepID=Q9X375_BACAN|nr:pXO1-106 [Bacillus anthracis]ACP17816.1 conserved hypothetical protein [Bacillus anthracis str. CDC 684]AHK41786.1 hypothetical protein BAPAT_pXO10168 [Bacillus anthracis str. SVA11]AIK60976.1 PD-(D/E)XK nuclease transposase family protein [Bacillus anthracis str. Vollum]AJG50976.1 PD-(D/E)XK nuclease transposase family protein [Bacillus anthracis str. Turkey32]AJH43195.1 PD-(D/E)XK nuclease transposase family protein [Bacillus anthracis str. Sterne]AJH97142.1 PD-(D/E)XK nuclease transposa
MEKLIIIFRLLYRIKGILFFCFRVFIFYNGKKRAMNIIDIAYNFLIIRASLHIQFVFMYNKNKEILSDSESKPLSNQKLVNLRIDFAFKQLFGTSRREDILLTLLNAMLADSLKSSIRRSAFASRI